MHTPNRADVTHVLQAVETLAQQIKDSVDSMEAERRLRPDLARALMEADVFRMGVPRAYNGVEFDPMSQVQVVEELSRINGSVGWLAMIGTAASSLAAFLPPPCGSTILC